MDKRMEIIQGVHPGKLIERDLKKKTLTQRNLSALTSIPFQTLNAIITGKRNLTTQQALKIEASLGYEVGFLAILQTLYDIKQCTEKDISTLNIQPPRIRKSLFWDTDFDTMNWAKYKKAVIKRVFERGNNVEVEEICRYYNLTQNEQYQFSFQAE